MSATSWAVWHQTLVLCEWKVLPSGRFATIGSGQSPGAERGKSAPADSVEVPCTSCMHAASTAVYWQVQRGGGIA